MKRPLILVGGGGHCKSVIEAAHSSGVEIAGIIDMPEFLGDECLGIRFVGSDDSIPKFVEDFDFVVTLGFIKNPERRIELHKFIKECGGQFGTVIASTANVSRYAHIGEGTVVLHNACVNAGASVGVGCIVNTLSCIEHDTVIGDYSHISTGALINGDCSIGNGVFVGSGAIVSNGLSVSGRTILGAGSVLTENILTAGTYVGIPAKRIR
ncbi:MAG: acetyltransferase [Bacteroidales bacterium]|nr:acetyltransferase [Bacteroidales bacterium]